MEKAKLIQGKWSMTVLTLFFCAITHGQVSKATYNAMYSETFSCKSEQLLSTNHDIQETFIVDWKKQQVLELISGSKQTYDIVKSFYSDDKKQLYIIFVEDKKSDKNYRFMLSGFEKEDGTYENVISKANEETITFYFGEVRFE